MNEIILRMKKERAVNGDECELCTRPMKSRESLWTFEGDFAIFTICDDCKKKYEIKSVEL